jgi:hypothetical protein
MLTLILLAIFFGGWFVCAFSSLLILTDPYSSNGDKKFGRFLFRLSLVLFAFGVITLIYAYKTI